MCKRLEICVIATICVAITQIIATHIVAIICVIATYCKMCIKKVLSVESELFWNC